MHGACTDHSAHRPGICRPMIHPCWTATTMPWCPGTHSGLCTCHPTAYPHVQAHSQRVVVAPYHHTPTIASFPRCSCAMAYAHTHLHHTQPTATLHHCCHCSSLTCHHHCRHLHATAAAVYMPLPPLSMCHRHHRLHATATTVYVPPPPPSTCHRCHRLCATAATVYVPLPPPSMCHHCCRLHATATLKDWWIREWQQGNLPPEIIARKDCRQGSTCDQQTDPGKNIFV